MFCIWKSEFSKRNKKIKLDIRENVLFSILFGSGRRRVFFKTYILDLNTNAMAWKIVLRPSSRHGLNDIYMTYIMINILQIACVSDCPVTDRRNIFKDVMTYQTSKNWVYKYEYVLRVDKYLMKILLFFWTSLSWIKLKYSCQFLKIS